MIEAAARPDLGHSKRRRGELSKVAGSIAHQTPSGYNGLPRWVLACWLFDLPHITVGVMAILR
jgi:hypothetical protein